MRFALILGFVATAAAAQQPMGTVATHDAHVSGTLTVAADRATLLSNAAVTAGDHPATIALTRGGEALVCTSSEFHLLHAAPSSPALLFGINRGAFEIRGATQPQDTVLTPDLRATVEHAGILDLRLRVTPSGDTCVDNRGAAAPVLVFTSSFGSATYRILPGQHVLFEHGDLRAVVDRERSSCGCNPSDTPPVINTEAARNNPFPEAESAGLSTTQPAAPLTPPDGSVVLSTNPAASAQPIPLAPEASNTEAAQQHGGFFHSIGNFFKRLFR